MGAGSVVVVLAVVGIAVGVAVSGGSEESAGGTQAANSGKEAAGLVKVGWQQLLV